MTNIYHMLLIFFHYLPNGKNEYLGVFGFFFLYKQNPSFLRHLYARRQATELRFSLERRAGMSAVAVLFGLDFSCNLGLLQSSSVFSIGELLPCSRGFCCQCETFSLVLQRGREGEGGGTDRLPERWAVRGPRSSALYQCFLKTQIHGQMCCYFPCS